MSESDQVTWRRCGCVNGGFNVTLGAGLDRHVVTECHWCGATWSVDVDVAHRRKRKGATLGDVVQAGHDAGLRTQIADRAAR